MATDGEQGLRLYEFLEKLQPDEGVTLEELMSVADTESQNRVAQILTQIRRGVMAQPHQRKGQYMPPLNVNFDRKTNRYYNLGASNISGRKTQGHEVLRTWAMDIGTRLDSFNRTFGAQLSQAELMEDKEAARAMLGQLPYDDIGQIRDLADQLNDEIVRSQRLRRRLSRSR